MNLRALIKATAGFDPAPATLARAVRERLQRGGSDAGSGQAADYAPQPGTPEFDALLDLVVVPESWMFRDPAVFAAALRFVRRRLAARPGAQVRILSLPCAGGEEPYSMAMALADAGIPPERCRIDAVDLSRAAIERAHDGRYTRNAFRGADLAFRERWFTPDGEDYRIDPALRAWVRFRQGNLFAPDPATLGGYDLVFCRNLLIYFDDDAQARAAGAIDALLAPGGLLLSGYAEAPAFCRHGYAPTPGGEVFALTRSGAAPAPAHAPLRAREADAGVLAGHRPRAGAPAPSSASAPEPAAHALLARAQRLADAGQLADAEADCRAVLAAYPGEAQAWFLLGLVSDCAGDARAAERYWRRCLYLQPEHYEALCSMALLHEQRGDGVLGASLRRRAARIYGRGGGGPA